MQIQRDFADFVEEQRTAIREFKSPGAITQCTGEGAFDVTEELAFVEFTRDRSAVDFDQRAFCAVTVTVNFTRDNFLACAAFTEDQHGGVCRCDQFDLTSQQPAAPEPDRSGRQKPLTAELLREGTRSPAQVAF